jgi:hypothetical protein
MTTATADKPTATRADEPRATRFVVANPYVKPIRDAIREDPAGRYVLNGDFSTVPYEGRKNANEAYSVMAKMHAAGRDLGIDLRVRRVPNDDGVTCKITFKAVDPAKAREALAGRAPAKRAPRKVAAKKK